MTQSTNTDRLNPLNRPNQELTEVLKKTPILPVLRVDNITHTQQQVEMLSEQGCTTIEITLRTPLGLKAIERLAKESHLRVGAGTATNYQQCIDAYRSGATFIVSPGVNQGILKAVKETQSPFLGGVSTLSEAMALYEQGYQMMKFFPAEANGGTHTLRAWYEPMPHLYFCPTGGINPYNYKEYLSLPNVICVGSSKPLELTAAE